MLARLLWWAVKDQEMIGRILRLVEGIFLGWFLTEALRGSIGPRTLTWNKIVCIYCYQLSSI